MNYRARSGAVKKNSKSGGLACHSGASQTVIGVMERVRPSRVRPRGIHKNQRSYRVDRCGQAFHLTKEESQCT